MKSIQIAVVVFLCACALQADFQPIMKHPDNISGSLAAVRAFQAMREGNINALIETLRSKPNLVNETLTFKTEKEEFKLRLIHVGPLTKNADILRVLAASDARIAAKDSLGRNVGHYASFGVPELNVLFGYTPHEDGYAAAVILKMLYDFGIDLDVPDESGRRALHYAAEAGDPLPIRQLLSFGVEIDPLDNEGYSPLKRAASKLNLSAADVLQTNGSMSKVGKLDYLAGFKNRVGGLAYDNTIGIASVIAFAVALKMSSWWMRSENPKADLSKKRDPKAKPAPGKKPDDSDEDDADDDDDKHDADGHPPVLELPKAPAVVAAGGSGGGNVAVVRQRGASVSQIAALKPKVQAKAPVPNVEAQAPVRNRELSTLQKLQAATKALTRAHEQELEESNGDQKKKSRNRAKRDELAKVIEETDALLTTVKPHSLGEQDRMALNALNAAIRLIWKKLNPQQEKQPPAVFKALKSKAEQYPEALRSAAAKLYEKSLAKKH